MMNLMTFNGQSCIKAPTSVLLLRDNDYNFENLHCTTTNLKDHLRWQLELSPMSDIDRAIATTIIDAINSDGFLTLSISELHTSLTSDEHPLDVDEIKAVRHRLQLFDPVGCASTNLTKTLLLQLEQLPMEYPAFSSKQKDHYGRFELLGQHNYRQLMKNHQVDEKTIDAVLKIIEGLKPRPGNLIFEDITEYIIPDLTVKKINNQWKVHLNQSVLPHLSINNQYASLIQRADNSADNQFFEK